MKLMNNKIALIFALGICAFNTMYAQPNQKKKIDGVVAVVGDYVVLDSDIDKTFIELKAQGADVKDISRCEMLGKLLEDKLYAHHAIQDSIVVSDAEVNEFMNSQLDQMVEQVGSVEKVIQFYNKKNLEDFKTYFFDVVKMNKLTSQMQRRIVDDVEITPEEVRTFFAAIPKEELPVFGAEMEVAQIVVKPVITQVEKQKVIDRLKELKKEVQEGSSFSSRAVIYSEDKGSSSNGGFYKITKKTQFVKEFKEVAFSLQEGEISEPFETEFGFHIIYLEKIRGQELDLRHILMSPKVTNEAVAEAKTKIETIRKRITDGEITFAEAARQFSDEKETRNSGGILVNPRTMATRFELTKMDPALYSQVSELKDNEVSLPLVDEDQQNGNKKFKLITVTNRYEEHTADFAKDYLKIKDLALKEKQIKAVAKWAEGKIKETYVKINGEYRDCNFASNWLKK